MHGKNLYHDAEALDKKYENAFWHPEIMNEIKEDCEMVRVVENR